MLYFVGAAYCGTCNRMKRDVIQPLALEYPSQVIEVDTKRYCGDLARIDKRERITTIPVTVVEDNGAEVARAVGMVGIESLRILME